MTLCISVHGLAMTYDSFAVLDGVDFTVPEGEMLAILGANGAGKSTLLRCLSRVLEPSQGAVYLDGSDLRRFSNRELARLMAVVPQSTEIDFDFTVEEVVLMGRLPHLHRFQQEGKSEREAARRAMRLTGVEHLAARSAVTLSGGERQRVLIARALCQEPRVLLLDEPTANLDIGYQSSLLDLAMTMNRDDGVTVIAAIHDLNLAAMYFRRFLLLSSGKILAAGTAEEVFTEENIRTSYGVPVQIYRHPLHGRLQVSVAGVNKQAPQGGVRLRVHVVGGGEEALPALDFLREAGCALSLGPVTTQDSGYRYARFYGFEVVEMAPFSPLSEENYQRHLQLMLAADLVVVPPVPFGPGNLRCLEAVEEAGQKGAPVLLLEMGDPRERDYCGGAAARLLAKLRQHGAISAGSWDELGCCLEKVAAGTAERSARDENNTG